MNIKEQYFTCKKCGESKIWGEFRKGKKFKDGIQKICKKCDALATKNSPNRKVIQRKYREKNAEKIKEARDSRTNEQLQKIKDSRRKYKGTPKGFIAKVNYRLSDLNRAAQRRHSTKIRIGITDKYTRDCLKIRGFTREQINQNPELINIQRTIIQMKRLCKTSNN